MVISDMIMDGSVPLEAMREAVGVGQHTDWYLIEAKTHIYWANTMCNLWCTRSTRLTSKHCERRNCRKSLQSLKGYSLFFYFFVYGRDKNSSGARNWQNLWCRPLQKVKVYSEGDEGIGWVGCRRNHWGPHQHNHGVQQTGQMRGCGYEEIICEILHLKDAGGVGCSCLIFHHFSLWIQHKPCKLPSKSKSALMHANLYTRRDGQRSVRSTDGNSRSIDDVTKHQTFWAVPSWWVKTSQQAIKWYYCEHQLMRSQRHQQNQCQSIQRRMQWSFSFLFFYFSVMKQRAEITGSKNDNWETPNYILDWIKREIFWGKDFFDPCPLAIDEGGGIIEYSLIDFLLIGRKETMSTHHTTSQTSQDLWKRHLMSTRKGKWVFYWYQQQQKQSGFMITLWAMQAYTS